MGRFVHLVCVTQNNNNKFYDMVEQGDILQATYGRIGSSKPYNVYDAKRGMTWDRLQKVAPGCSSLHAHAGPSLRNDEVIVYREDQVTIKYLVELKVA